MKKFNQTKAWNTAAEFFNLQEGQVMHHKDKTMKYTDPERYKQWNPEDLVVMTRAEHQALHNHDRKGKHLGGRKKGCAPTRGSIGMHWYNNGTECIICFPEDVPDGFVKGRISGENPNRDSKGRFTHANTEVS